MTWIRACGLVLLAASSVAAQRTWIVDAGGGGDFKTLAAAFAGAKDGDTLRVKPGRYFGAQTSKGLRVLGEHGTMLVLTTFGNAPPIRVTQLSASSTFVLRGFQSFAHNAWQSTAFVATQCKGSIVIEDCALGNPMPGRRKESAMMVFESCRAVSLSGVTASPGLQANASQLSVEYCRLVGADSYRLPFQSSAIPATPGVVTKACTLVVTDSVIVGGGKGTTDRFSTGRPGFDANACDIVLVGRSSVTAKWSGQPSIEGHGSSRVLADRSVTLTQGSRNLLAMHTMDLPATRSALASHSAKLSVTAPGGSLAVAFVALSSSPLAVPGLGQLWIDPASIVWTAGMSLDSRGHGQATIPLPTGARMNGLPLYVQSLVVSGKARLSLSNASVFTLR